ncbi:hypothetical protein [Pseudomonas zhanjiangensis]|uniref:Uncharacterized protein n=1 Tax=Pseudomonas zhanjiangensis TaxID=3239015 RepID=A0ABV3YZF0_9PSED
MRYSIDEKPAAILCVLLGVLVAATIAPAGSYFFGNFIYFWLPQVGVFLLPVIVSSRPAVISGAALVSALYLAAFYSWNYLNGPDSMAWLGYLFSLPGAAIGAVIGALHIKNKLKSQAAYVVTAIAASTFMGLAINQMLVCSTVMYCGF